MTPRLKSLSIENFRSIRGPVVVPLDAQVILIHATNGMGKTSVLSALELGLTGMIAHLEDQSKYQDFLTNIGTTGGSIRLMVDGLPAVAPGTGQVLFKPGSFSASPALDEAHIGFFAERCYLPQAVLGRLLEIYDQKKTTNSRLTQFVKELLRLDPLDALVDGLDHAFNVTRIRKIAPAYKELEYARDRLDHQFNRESSAVATAQEAVDARLARPNDVLRQLDPSTVELQVGFDSAVLREWLAQREAGRTSLSQIAQEKSEVASLMSGLASLGQGTFDYNIADRERTEASAASEYDVWINGPGSEIFATLDELRQFHSDLSPADRSNVIDVMTETLEWCAAEMDRCRRLLDQHGSASRQLASAQTTVQRATARILEINEALEVGTKDARTLANALAGIAPHVEGEICPVCDRNFAELNIGSLTTHIAATIANLTSESGRLQALATERATESEILASARRDEVAAERMVLQPDALVDLLRRQSSITSIRNRLEGLRGEALRGRGVFLALDQARRNLADARRVGLASVKLLPEIQAVVERLTGRLPSAFSSLQEGLHEADTVLSTRQETVQKTLSLRATAELELDQYEREVQVLAARTELLRELSHRAAAIKSTFSAINDIRATAKSVATAASQVRSGIVRDVFSGSLNTVWKDLFVRLAPNEQFVPQFRLPTGDDGKVEAVLETFHRSGQSSGPPGAMLSQGNLNTAALTLFLALNLSVPAQLPWLVLDDPVQSMDDVHIAQFAALLRTFSKGLDKQIVVAVHERALFEYLTLELNPAFAGDSLITVEISRNFNGETVADPHYLVFEEDKALVA